MTLGHLVRLHRGVFDAREVLDEKRPLVVKKLVLVLLVGQENFIDRLRNGPEESAQLLLAVLAAHAQLQQHTQCDGITHGHSSINKTRWSIWE